VSRSQFPWAIAVIMILATAVGHIVGFVVAGIALFIGYWISLFLHPRVRHTGFRSCNGTGEVRGSVFTWTFRKCPGCQSGRQVRWGAGHIGADRIRGEYRRNAASRQAAKQNHATR
jgi:hypothetical protein